MKKWKKRILVTLAFVIDLFIGRFQLLTFAAIFFLFAAALAIATLTHGWRMMFYAGLAFYGGIVCILQYIEDNDSDRR
jgi:hypothetical protein